MPIAIQIHFVAEIFDTALDPDDCNNVGPACYGCPQYDRCDHHYPEEY